MPTREDVATAEPITEPTHDEVAGSLIDADQRDKVAELVDDARGKGADVVVVLGPVISYVQHSCHPSSYNDPHG